MKDGIDIEVDRLTPKEKLDAIKIFWRIMSRYRFTDHCYEKDVIAIDMACEYVEDAIRGEYTHPLVESEGLLGAWKVVSDDSDKYARPHILSWYQKLASQPLTEEALNSFLWKYY